MRSFWRRTNRRTGPAKPCGRALWRSTRCLLDRLRAQ
jgi:hypothetical protein